MSTIPTTPGLGDNENINSTTFIDRMTGIGLFKPYDGSKCGDPLRISQWAELKSSLLAQSIISNNVIESELLGFVRLIIEQLYNANNDKQGFINDFNTFSTALLTSPHFNEFNSYPVSQAQAYGGDSHAAYNDVLILYNFIKFMLWSGEKTIYNGNLWDPNICKVTVLSQHLVVHIFMQPIFNFFGMVRR